MATTTVMKSRTRSTLIPKTRIVWCLHSVVSFIESCDRSLQSFCGVTPVKLVHAFEVQERPGRGSDRHLGADAHLEHPVGEGSMHILLGRNIQRG